MVGSGSATLFCAVPAWGLFDMTSNFTVKRYGSFSKSSLLIRPVWIHTDPHPNSPRCENWRQITVRLRQLSPSPSETQNAANGHCKVTGCGAATYFSSASFCFFFICCKSYLSRIVSLLTHCDFSSYLCTLHCIFPRHWTSDKNHR